MSNSLNMSQFKRLIDCVLVFKNFLHILIFQILVLYILTLLFSVVAPCHTYIELLSRNAVCSSTLKGWIKEQYSLFPEYCCNIDYRKLVYNNEFYVTEFNNYFHKEMENYYLNATSSERSKHKKADSSFHNLRCLLCISMAISICGIAGENQPTGTKFPMEIIDW